MPDTKEWTLMFYLASDNPLAPAVISQLKSIKAAGFHKQANVIVQFDPYTELTPTHIFDVNVFKKATCIDKHQIGFTANDPKVHELLEDRLWNDEKDRHGEFIRKRLTARYPGYDPGMPPNGKLYNKGAYFEPDPQTSLNNFLTFCADFYPAKHYILFLLGHGVVVGNDVFMYDEHADEKTLSLAGLRTVLMDFNKRIKAHGVQQEDKSTNEGCLDLLSFHSCSVSSLEVAYELKDQARYMLASQGSTLVGNWPYRQILIRIFNDLAEHDCVREQSIGPIVNDIFSYCVSNSTDFLLAGYPYDLCLCDLRNIGATKDALEQLSKALIKGLECDVVKDSILLAHLEAQSFHYEMYTDILDFCRCLYKRTTGEITINKKTKAAEDDAGEEKETAKKVFTDDELERLRSGITDAVDNATEVISRCIVNSSIAGPDYQYARGFSLYFPWSRPVDGFLEKYGAYKLVHCSEQLTWLHFLKRYFRETRRDSFREERLQKNLIAELGEMIEAPTDAETAAEVELREDQLAVLYGQATSHYTPYALDGDKPVKTDATDPLGGVYSAPSLKNYPRDTRRLRDRTQPRGMMPRQRFPLNKGYPRPGGAQP